MKFKICPSNSTQVLVKHNISGEDAENIWGIIISNIFILTSDCCTRTVIFIVRENSMRF